MTRCTTAGICDRPIRRIVSLAGKIFMFCREKRGINPSRHFRTFGAVETR